MIFRPRKWLEPHLVESLDAVRFELRAWRGRLGRRKRLLPTRGLTHLQLGSGENRLPGFLNSDSFANRRAEAHIDVRFPLPFADDTWQGIYAHHLVEHLSYPDAAQLAGECRRVLKPGGIFRVIVPDLEVFIRRYAAPDAPTRAEIFRLYPDYAMKAIGARTPLEMLDYIFRDNRHNRHRSAWDWETAETRLREAGFSAVQRVTVNVSSDPMLAGHDTVNWAPFSLYVEAVK